MDMDDEYSGYANRPTMTFWNPSELLPFESIPETEFTALGSKWRAAFTGGGHVHVETLGGVSINGRKYTHISAHLYDERGDGLFREEVRAPASSGMGKWRGSGFYSSPGLTDAARGKLDTALTADLAAIPDYDTWKLRGERHAARGELARALEELATAQAVVAKARAAIPALMGTYKGSCELLGLKPEIPQSALL